MEEKEEKVVAIWVVPAGGRDAFTRNLGSVEWECMVFEKVHSYFLMAENGMAFWVAPGWPPYFMLSSELLKMLPFSVVYALPSGAWINVDPSVLLVAHLYKPYNAFMLVRYLDWEHAYEAPTGEVYPRLRSSLILGNLERLLDNTMFEEALQYIGTSKPLKVLAKCFEKYKPSIKFEEQPEE